MSFIKSKSKLLVIVMLFILVFGISSSFASTDVDDSVAVAGDVDNVVSSDGNATVTQQVNTQEDTVLTSDAGGSENLGSSDESVVSASDESTLGATTGNFTGLQALINANYGKTITLSQDYVYNSDFGKTSGMTITSSITINGNGHTIDGKSASRLFYISGSKVTLNNINFSNGYIASTGGGIQSTNTASYLTINYCNFNNIRGNDGNGGGLFIQSPYCSIDHCSFKNNYASISGGAINFNKANYCYNATLTNSYFENNIVRANGGAIETFSPNSKIINCTFVANKASECSDPNSAKSFNMWGGGAIVIYNGAPNIQIDNCKFYNNTACTGGAISSGNAANTGLKILNCVFDGNNATGHASCPNPLSLTGGAIFFNAANTTIHNSIFTNNNCLESNGGAIYSNAKNSVVDNCKFENNEAVDGDNFYASEGNSIEITNCGFDLFYVTADGTGDGLRAGAPTSFSNAVQSIEDGGRIYLMGTFTNLYNQRVEKPVIIEGYNNQVIINLAGLNNRAFTITASDVTVKGITFKNSLITGNGGVILWNGANGVVDDCTFENNTAANGGAIYWAGTKGKVIGSTFNKNTATANGGAVYWTGNDGSIDDSTFTNNKAVYGSAIFLKDGVSVFELKDTSFTSNVASTSGTVAAEKLTTFSLGGNSFSSNTVSSGDTDYYFYDNAPVITSALVYVSTTGSATSNGFTSSTPTTWAHAIQIIEEGGKIIFLNGNYDLGELTISKSIALVGSGNTVFNSNRKNRYFTINANNVTVENIIFNNGKATGNGGAIVWNGANGQVISSTFTSNQATGSGGAIYWTGANGKIDKSTFTGNTGSNGNALSSTKTVSVSNSVLQNQITLSLTGTVNYGTDEVVTGTFQSNPASSVTVYLDDATQGSVSVSSNKFTKSLSRVSVGTHTIGVKDNNGNTYTFTSGNTFTVNRLGTVYISPSGTGTGASSGSPTTWDKVADIITDSGTVIFTAGTYTDFYGKTISKSWTLKNSGTVILNANNKGRIFSITDNNVNIEGFTFQNGKVTSGSGGAIYNTGTGVTIKNSIFTGNSAPTANIISSTKAITITNSQLKNPFTITTNSINFGTAETIVITFPSGTAPSKGTIKLNGEEKGTYDVTSNQLQASIPGLAVGSYVVTQTRVILKEDF